jgi:F-type H+-transporting ATPase subunit b
MISINATLLVQIVQFLILLFVLNHILFKPILRIMAERDRHIADTKGNIENLELETVRLQEEFVSRMSDARKKASHERYELLLDSMKEVEGLIDESRKEVLYIRETAERDAEEELDKSKRLLHDQAAGLADEIIEKVIGRRIAG